MALITKITAKIADIRQIIKPEKIDSNDLKLNKSQTFNFSFKNINDPDIVNMGAETSQEAIEDFTDDKNDNKPNFNWIA